jgi:fatty-acyl-CoA synthase
MGLTDRQGESLGALLDGVAARAPAAHALIVGEQAISFAELAEESRRVAGGLAALGIGPGDRVALWLPNTPAWLAIFFACARLGAIAVAVNTRFRSAELADILGRSGAKILMLWPDFAEIGFAGILEETDPAALAGLERIIAYGAATPPARIAGKPVVAYEALRSGPAFAGDRGGGPVGVILFTTSGTTKAPKFVLHDHFSLARHAGNVAPGFGYDVADAVLLHLLPLCGVFGFCQALAGLLAGRPGLLPTRFDAAESARHIARHRVTGFNATDEMFARLIDLGEGESLFRSLRQCGYAAFDPAHGDIVPRAEREGLHLLGLYGASEFQALFARQDLAAPIEERGQPGGRPIAGDYHVRIRDPESGRLLEAGESGEIEVAGPSLMAGYFGNPEATAKAMAEDGFFRSGDLGRLRGDGSFVFEARMGDVLRLGGFLVAPAEIEAYLQDHPTIAAAQVVAAPAGTRTVAIAFVVLRPGAPFDETALRAYCSRGLARYKNPARFIALDAFPVTTGPNGTKIQRTKLRDMAVARLAEG